MNTDPASRIPVLIIDDREDLSRFCERSLGDTYAFHRVATGSEARDFLARPCAAEAILLDRDFTYADPSLLLGPPEEIRNEGLHVMRWLRREHPLLPVIMVTGYRDQHAALEAAGLGADFLAWEDLLDQPNLLRARLQRALETTGNRPEGVLARFRELGIVGDSPAFTRTLISLHQALGATAPILLLGETGTGKDTLAFAVHALSGDSSRPYVSVNVAALNPNLIEAELFGHARGAYTGAGQSFIGKLRYADGGTLFLNEVADLAPEVQAKLLTVLERSEVVPVGDVHSFPARFRLITATSQDLKALVQQGRFRRDLYHRIAWHTISIPSLKERQADIPALVRSFLHEVGRDQEGSVLGIAREAQEYLCGLPWEGNIRELRAVLEAAGASATYLITLSDVLEVVRRNEVRQTPEVSGGNGTKGASADPLPPGGSPPARAGEAQVAAHNDPEVCEGRVFGDLTYREITGRYFLYLKRRSEGRLSEVARRAGIGKTTVYEWKERYGDPPPA